MKIAIDGPSGAGKSTISKLLAKELGFLYIDTGAMYRAIGLCALSYGYDTKQDVKKIVKMLSDVDIKILWGVDRQEVFLNGDNITDKIRTPEVSIAASDVAVIPEVRIKLVEMQRKLAEGNDVIMDGRDIATYVLPDAEIKIYLTATAEDRARRRYEELVEKGIETTYCEVLTDVNKRDKNDSEREFSPLKVADDATVIDTTGKSLDESIEFIKEFLTQEMKKSS